MAVLHAWTYNRFSDRPLTRDEKAAVASGEAVESAEDAASMKTQVETNARYCEYHGIVIDNVLKEPFTSARFTPLFKRPEGSKLRDIPKGIAIVAMDMTRIFRDQVDGLTTIRYFNKHGTQLRLSDQGGNAIDVSTPDGFAFASMKLMMAEYEPMCTAVRTSRGMKYRQANGQRMSRTDCVPYGMMADPDAPDGLVENPDELPAMQVILADHLKGEEPKQIAKKLRRSKFVCRNSKTGWTAQAVERAINGPWIRHKLGMA